MTDAVLISSGTLSAAANYTDTTNITSSYKDYLLVLDDIFVGTDGELLMTIYLGGVEQTGSNYSYGKTNIDGNPSHGSLTGQTSFSLSDTGLDTANPYSGHIKFFDPSNASTVNAVRISGGFRTQFNIEAGYIASGIYTTAGALTGFKIVGSGTLTGSYALYGIDDS